jgi:hypothetical protein
MVHWGAMGHSTKDTHSLQGGNFCRSGGGGIVEKFVSDNSKCIYNRTSEGEGGMDLFWNDFMG